MTLPIKKCQKWNIEKFEKCPICWKIFSTQEITKHFNICHGIEMNNLLSNFDFEISKLKLYYDNKLNLFKDVVHLSELCKKCSNYQNPKNGGVRDIEDINLKK